MQLSSLLSILHLADSLLQSRAIILVIMLLNHFVYHHLRHPAISREPQSVGNPIVLKERLSDASLVPPDTTFQQAHRSTRSQSLMPGSNHPHFTRPLSSAEETGPVTKKLRSAVRQPDATKSSKPLKSAMEDPSKKVCNRYTLVLLLLISCSLPCR